MGAKTFYDSSRNEERLSKKMGYSENDFNESGTHGEIPSRLRNTHQNKLTEEAFENEERTKRMFSKNSEAQNELHKSSFLGFNGVEGNDTQGYFTRVDIDMSPGGSSSNGSRSPNATSQGRTLSPIKDINQQYSSSEQNHDLHRITKHNSSPKMRESTDRNQFRPISSE